MTESEALYAIQNDIKDMEELFMELCPNNRILAYKFSRLVEASTCTIEVLIEGNHYTKK